MKLHLICLSVCLPVVLIGANAFAGRSAGDDVAKYFDEGDGLREQTGQAGPPIDWAQPPLGCVEEMVPHVPTDRPCLDLTQVASALKDWPADITPADHDYWYARRRALTYCRSAELLRREAASPGSQTAGAIETSWMIVDSVKNYKENVAAIYKAEALYGVPAHVLTGAIYQESIFSELGIADDGGNFSCGQEQINLIGWCEWANQQSAMDKLLMAWPIHGVDCSNTSVINLSLLRPWYAIAKTRLNGLPEYRLQKEHFANVYQRDVEGLWPEADAKTQDLRYQVIRSFIMNCSNPTRGTLAKAHELLGLYSDYIPAAVKAKDRYMGKDRFARSCNYVSTSDTYPLHAGWLMAVAAYNAGPRSIDAVAYYNQWDPAHFNDPLSVASLTPDQIIPSIYGAGAYNPINDKIEFTSLAGHPLNWIWFKACVNQRHVARVIQNVTLLPEFFVDTLEGPSGCQKSTFDADGKLVKTSVPVDRQTSSGHR
jgi:hypothetical protein